MVYGLSIKEMKCSVFQKQIYIIHVKSIYKSWQAGKISTGYANLELMQHNH